MMRTKMWGFNVVVVVVVVAIFLITVDRTSGLHENHGTIKMGVKNSSCDDGETNIEWDLTPMETLDKTCDGGRIQVDLPIHHCMQTELTYEDIPPRGGPHRPIWPVYGEYQYLPVGRWVHAMEHGAVVLLYDPCADVDEVEKLKNVVKNCLRKHVITPSEMLTKEYPMALLTWGCKLEFSYVDEKKAMEFIRIKAMDPARTNEYNLSRDGDYKYLLISRSEVVPGSDFSDSNVCPQLGGRKDGSDAGGSGISER